MRNKLVRRSVCASRFIESLELRQLLSTSVLDTSFGTGGKASANFDSVDVTGYSMAVQSDGKVVEVGEASDNGFALARYNANGTLDTSFGFRGNGKIVEQLKGVDIDEEVAAYAVAIQPNGKILVGGAELGHPDAVGGDTNMFLIRLNANGDYDSTFGSGGVVILNNFHSTFAASAAARAITIQNDGKIVVVGDELQGQEFGGRNDNMVIARLNTNGSLDKSFNGDGEANIDLGDNEAAEAVAIDYNGTAGTNSDYGKIIVVGHKAVDGSPGGTYKIVVARYSTNGSLDKSFNKTGTLVTSGGSAAKSTDAEAVTIESGGLIVIAGDAGPTIDLDPHNFFLARFTATGTLDKTFGTGGNVTTDLGGDDRAESIVIGGFGQQLMVGGVSGGSIALAAYSLDGAIDQSFGNKGSVVTGFSSGVGTSKIGLSLSPNHTIVAGGGNNFSIARYFDIAPNVSVSSIDPTAGPTTHRRVGKLLEPVPNPASMIVARDEKLSVAARVFFTISGSAIAPSSTNLKRGIENYTLTGMTIEPAPGNAKVFTAYVDIPAGQTFTTVTFTPNIIPAVNTTAIFSLVSNVNYQTSFPASQTITLLGTNPTPPPPTTTTLTDTADTYIQDGSSADTNFGTATQLLVKKSSTTGQNRETYLKFDLSSLGTVNSVKLNLFGSLNNTDQPSLVTQVFSIADNSWLETGITWNKRRTPGATALASATITGTTPALYTFDVTAYIKAQLAAGIKTVSFVLINSANSSPAVIFNSREASSNKPTLVVT